MAMVPFTGWLSTGSKLGRKALKAADKIDDVAKIVHKADDVSGTVKEVEKVSKWVDEAGNLKWPVNSGFKGAPKTQILEPGNRIDRFGSEAGNFVSPKGTPFEMRSLPKENINSPYNIYEIVKPVEVRGGEITSWFDQPGGGTQYMFEKSISELLEQGIIRKVGK